MASHDIAGAAIVREGRKESSGSKLDTVEETRLENNAKWQISHRSGGKMDTNEGDQSE